MGQSREPKDWKYLLQQTGLPLEQSVGTVLRRHGVVNARELQFERTDEHGKTILSSVDLTGNLRVQPFDARVVVECKYRRDDVQWVFAPANLMPYQKATRGDVLNVLPGAHLEIKLGEKGLATKMSIPVVGKGVEIKGADTFDTPIRAALYQLRHGTQQLIRMYLRDIADPFGRDFEGVPAFIPIIVTTADLWRLRDDVGVEEVRHASDFAEVATKANVLLIHEPPDSIFSREARSRLLADLADYEKEGISSLFGGLDGYGFSTFARRVADSPSFFYVMSLDHFSKSFSSLKSYLDNFPYTRVEGHK